MKGQNRLNNTSCESIPQLKVSRKALKKNLARFARSTVRRETWPITSSKLRAIVVLFLCSFRALFARRSGALFHADFHSILTALGDFQPSKLGGQSKAGTEGDNAEIFLARAPLASSL